MAFRFQIQRNVAVRQLLLLWLMLIIPSLSPLMALKPAAVRDHYHYPNSKGERELDRITALPGQPPVTFSQFSGYVTVNEEHGRALFYWLTEATTEPEKKPLVLWLNGGPGCSSVAYGASEEIGPFRIHKTGSSLYLNKYSWNQEANILFLESPAGVGYSYTNTSSDLMDSGDKRTVKSENKRHKLLWDFNAAVEKLAKTLMMEVPIFFGQLWMLWSFSLNGWQDFYITGESYAGHYVPQLAQQILEYNSNSSNPIIKIKGIMVGNAATDSYYDSIGTVTYWWTHSIISDQTYKSILKSCNFSQEIYSKECGKALNYATNHEFGDIDPYSIYTPTCKVASMTTNYTVKTIRFKNSLLQRRVSGYDPCTENYAEKYYNKPDVQRALHANTTGIPYKWTACSDVLLKNWKDSASSVLPIHKKLAAAGLRIWIFSGDTDSVVPVTATRFSLNHLNLRIKTKWYPWYVDGQVGGWTEIYEGLTFATVRGAGHEVPLFQPKRAYVLFKSFLEGKQLPES